MDLYSVIVFVHVLAAIVLVGGSFAADLVGHRTRRARSVEGVKSLVGVNMVLGRVIPLSAVVVLLAGIYLSTAGGWWSDGWLIVSLVLFVAAGFIAGRLIDPPVKEMAGIVEEAPNGPVTPELGAALAPLGSRVALAGSVLGGVDVAIVFLMITKPGTVGSIVAAVVGIAFGTGLGLLGRGNRPAGLEGAHEVG